MYDKLIAFLDQHKAHYRLIDHAPEGRTEIVSPLRGNALHQAAKCMVLAVHKGKKEVQYVLAVIPGDKKIDFEAVKSLMNASYVSFAPAQIAEKMSGSVVGTVLPFSSNPDLELIVDPMLLENTDELFFNAARLDRSMALNTKDYVAMVKPRLAPLAQRDEVRTPQSDNTDPLDLLRHSYAHLLAAAVLELYPDAKPTLGPPIDDGFYYDIDFSSPISENDLPKIEEKMRELVKDWKQFERVERSASEAKKQYPDNPYKRELIEEFAGQGKTISFYKAGAFEDLCRGGHVESPAKELKHFKLLSVAGAYWRGSEKNKMLTRIYGTAFPSKQELDEYLHLREEAKKRDHKKLGKELDLFVFAEEVGPGLPLFTEKGTTIYRELERFVVDEEIKRGYVHVRTPDLARVRLYEISGHYPYYKDSMYPVMEVDDEKLVLRPMTCPHHFILYKSRPHSYRDLPLRIAEVAKLYRYEQSGELMGLLRVRSFCLADSHMFCRRDQAASVVKEVIDLIDYVAKTLGLVRGKDYWFRLSLGDRSKKDKYYDDPKNWEIGEATLRQVLKEIDAPFTEAPNEAAFYGPKIDVQMLNVNGKEDTAFTVQYDFCLPARFKLEYTNEKGEPERPVVIHRSSIGALERTMAYLIERFAGAFPVWLSPTQVVVLPVKTDHNEPAIKFAQELKSHGIRAVVDDSNETIGNKIRKASGEKIPYQLVFGDKEISSDELIVRIRGIKDQVKMTRKEFLTTITTQIITRAG